MSHASPAVSGFSACVDRESLIDRAQQDWVPPVTQSSQPFGTSGDRASAADFTHADSSPQYNSPALVSTEKASAFEMKCLLPEDVATALEQALKLQLRLDDFAAAGHGSYRITTLSTDTPDFCVFHRRTGFARQKFRIRRYGSDSVIFLEQKTRRGSRVSKHRTKSSLSDLCRLSVPGPEATWSGQWFHDHVCRQQLKPVCLMSYERRAWFGDSENGPVRLTFDRQLRGALIQDWCLEFETQPSPIVSGVICEFKFSHALPRLFKDAIQQFALNPAGFSKYRNCITSLNGLDGPKTTPEDSHA